MKKNKKSLLLIAPKKTWRPVVCQGSLAIALFVTSVTKVQNTP